MGSSDALNASHDEKRSWCIMTNPSNNGRAARANNVFARPSLAMGFGAFLFAVETCRHFDSLAHLPLSWADLPFHDWAAALFLLLAGYRARRDLEQNRALQAAAWAFSLSLLIAAFFAHVEELSSGAPGDELMPESAFVGIIGLLSVVALLALVATLNPRRSRSD